MKNLFLSLLLCMGISAFISAQSDVVSRDTLKNDTIFIINNVNRPVEFSKAIGKYLYILNIIPDDLSPKLMKLQVISSISTEIDPKLIQVVNNKHLIFPLALLTEKYYTLYIKKGNATLVSKKLICR
jgi:hypothetical protein